MAASQPVPSVPLGVESIRYQRYVPLVRRIAMKTARNVPASVSVEDLVNVGWVGLLEAAQRRGPSMSEEEFEAFASYRVRGAILDYLRSLDPMGRRMRAASRRVIEVIAELSAEFGRAPESEEVAERLGMSIDEYNELLGEIAEADAARFDVSDISALSAGGLTPEGAFGQQELVETVAIAISQLPHKLQLVLALLYQEECSLRDIGRVLEVSESRICQLHMEAICRVRAILEGKAYRRAQKGKRA